MEVLKIVAGLVGIVAFVVLFGSRGGEETAEARPVERGFSSEESSARFVSVEAGD